MCYDKAVAAMEPSRIQDTQISAYFTNPVEIRR